MSNWIKWEGKGEAPTGMVMARLRDGFESKEAHDAINFSWSHREYASDIIAYKPLVPVDMVNSPPHYTQGGIECIDAIRAALTPEEFRGHCRATAIKYLWRINHKASKIENVNKAIWYLEKLKESLNGDVG